MAIIHPYTVYVSQALNLDHTLKSGQAFRWRQDGEWYHGILNGIQVKLKQVPLGLEYQTLPGSEVVMESLLHRYFRLDDDLDGIYAVLGKDTRLQEAFRQYKGLRLLRQEPWECLVTFLCSIDSNIPRISRTVEALARHFGTLVFMNQCSRFTFPTPDSLAGTTDEYLRSLGLGFRAPYLLKTANLIARGNPDLSSLRNLTYQTAKDELLKLPGVGDKVADCVLLFSLDKLESFPVDRWVQRALTEWYLSGKQLSVQALRKWAMNHFGIYGGYAQQYLFQLRRLTP